VSGLPQPPKVELSLVADRSPSSSGEPVGFLTLRRLELRVGEQPDSFRYDLIERRALDAVVVVAHYEADGQVWVYLRSCIRPPVARRGGPYASSGVLWEVPAGLVEPGEDAALTASRELGEELGFEVASAAMEPLGPWVFPAPGFIGEAHVFFHVAVDPAARKEPPGDGSPLEAGAAIVSVTLDEALAACARGEIRDAKTELALRRFADVVRLRHQGP
jgi:ADP-ribose pyrophosphatase